MHSDLVNTYGNRVRVRVCGLCWDEGRLLLVNHSGLTDGDFWAPPGGGVDFGSTLRSTVERELQEETGLECESAAFLFGCEVVRPPLHAVELFFEATRRAGELRVGYDPEIQIIAEVRFFSADEILSIPSAHRHGIFERAVTESQLRELSGFYQI